MALVYDFEYNKDFKRRVCMQTPSKAKHIKFQHCHVLEGNKEYIKCKKSIFIEHKINSQVDIR